MGKTERKDGSKPKIHAGHMEVAVAKLIGWRVATIVPNVSWGLGLRHECDLLILDKLGRLSEVEIKISKSDLKADFRKGHNHISPIIGRLIYAVPDELVDFAKTVIPEKSGLITVKWTSIGWQATWVRYCKHGESLKLTAEQKIKLMSLGCMRIWTLKEALYNRPPYSRV